MTKNAGAITEGGALVHTLQPVFAAMRSRELRVTRLDVLASPAHADDDRTRIGAPGSMTVFVSRRGSAAIDEVRAAVIEGGARALRLLDRIASQTRSRAEVTLDDAVAMMVAEPVFAELRYGDNVVAPNLFLPRDLDVVMLLLPYNGGRLAREGFVLAQWCEHGSDATLEALVVQTDPPLTAAERAALEMVPDDAAVNNVGVAKWCETTWKAVAVLVLIAAAAGLAVIGFKPQAPENHISEETLRELGPAASARQLLDMRRRALATLSRR